jgi:NADPH-dependent 2,4-dienoyl-CoA reductase/sulfur reductase-like enzyme
MILSRRRVLQVGLAGLAFPSLARAATPRIVVVGGGFAGAMAARTLAARGFDVKLIEPNATYTACPMSNAVIGGFRPMDAQYFSYRRLVASGVRVVTQTAQGIDPAKREVILSDGVRLPYEKLVIAPGIDLRFDALPGYDEQAAGIMPHAWKAGPQTLLLRQQLEAMPDGGLIGMVIPATPYRCPPGPYERASLIAHYLKTRKPKSKLILFDAKDSFSKQKLFQAAWERLYPGLIEWVPLSQGGKVIEVIPSERVIVTEFGRQKVDVGNVIPPQRAGAVVQSAGLADRSGWCPVRATTFESTLMSNAYVIGDAAIMGTMPKSAFAAHVQAIACAAAIDASLQSEGLPPFKLINACYSLISPDEAISVTGVYQARNDRLVDVEGSGGVSAADLSADGRAMEARYAEDWFNRVTWQTYG